MIRRAVRSFEVMHDAASAVPNRHPGLGMKAKRPRRRRLKTPPELPNLARMFQGGTAGPVSAPLSAPNSPDRPTAR
jgi:hypothetical protein